MTDKKNHSERDFELSTDHTLDDKMEPLWSQPRQHTSSESTNYPSSPQPPSRPTRALRKPKMSTINTLFKDNSVYPTRTNPAADFALDKPGGSHDSLNATEARNDTTLMDRIETAIAYVLFQRRKGLQVAQFSRFTLATASQATGDASTALQLVRKACKSGLAECISWCKQSETYEIGVPSPNWIEADAFTANDDLQWWVGKSRAEIHAGPFAGKGEVARVKSMLRKREDRREQRDAVATKEQRNPEMKLVEGVRRQRKKVNMDDSSSPSSQKGRRIQETDTKMKRISRRKAKGVARKLKQAIEIQDKPGFEVDDSHDEETGTSSEDSSADEDDDNSDDQNTDP